jgi:DNA polymerase-3 subunit gamma/tau
MAKQKPPAEPADAAPAEAYTVLARRYRPQTFADLVGQEPVARALANALQSNRVAHAYLFTGARGVGKTSTARILAKALNCEKGPTATPCGVCDPCRGIATGEDVDVLEIDGASNRGIDEVREIRGNVQYRPSRSRYKIYIIDEVHMLTPPAFNALLKTLEEPPPHVKFIFATTEAQRIPVTILSRCQRFDFPGIPIPRIVERLREIVSGEGLQADDGALELVARRAGGSMRDSQSLLDQLLAFGGDRLTAAQVHQLLGTAGDDRVAELAAAVLAPDPKRALELFDEAVVGGSQLGELLDQLVAYWRDLMVVHCAGADGRDVSVPARHRDALTAQAKALGLDAILAGLDVLSTTKARLRGSSHGRTLVEMALVRLGRLKDLLSVAQVAQLLTGARPDGGPPAPARAPSAAPVRTLPPEDVKKKPWAAAPSDGTPAPVELNEETLPAVWSQTLGVVGTILGRELEKAANIAIFGPNTLVLRFPGVYNQSCQYCADPERVGRVEESLKKITGRAWAVRVESNPSTGAEGTGDSPPAASGAPARPRRNPRDDAEKLPFIRRAIDALGAQVVRVDEGFGAPPGDGSAQES